MMLTRQEELEDFKRRIDLVAYAESRGYARDVRSSSVNSIAMKHPDGDKLLIGMGTDQHWIYCSVHDPSDNGSIIDFVTKRTGWNLGYVRRELRPWLEPGRPASGPGSHPPTASGTGGRGYEKPEPVVVDLAAVQQRYDTMPAIEAEHPYLTGKRGIPPSVYLSSRFRGRVRVDERGNVVFPHWNGKGSLCGFEVKNVGFTGFSKHGMKGMFGSGIGAADTRLVIAESALDLLSYAALFGLEGSRFVSTAGSMNPNQPALIRAAMLKLPDGGEVVAAVDHDDGGEAIHEQIEAVYHALRRPEIALRRHSPPTSGADWNDALRASVAEPGPSPGQG